jgi:hypothetical protein
MWLLGVLNGATGGLFRALLAACVATVHATAVGAQTPPARAETTVAPCWRPEYRLLRDEGDWSMDLDPTATFTVQPALTLTANWLFLWQTRRDDGLYGVAGNLLRSGRATRARFVGSSPGLEIRWQCDRHLSITADVAAFTAGPFLRETSPAKKTMYFSAWSTYRF